MSATTTQPTVMIGINGIRYAPGDADGWLYRFVTWVNCHTTAKAEQFEYHCGIFLRRLQQRKRADQIAAKVGYYKRSGYRVVLVGHSNGADLIARVLDACGTSIDAVHLISPAANEEDFAEAIREGQVQRLHIYGSRNDGYLRIARYTTPLISWLGWGYGSMGLRGREFAKMFPTVVLDHSDDTCGHSTWLQRGPRFEALMNLIKTEDLADQVNPPLPLP